MDSIEQVPLGHEAAWLSTAGVCDPCDLRSPLPWSSASSGSDDDVLDCPAEARLEVLSEDSPSPRAQLSDSCDDHSHADDARLSDDDARSHPDSDAGTASVPTQQPSGWVVGQNAGSWVGHSKPLVAQSIVFLMNVFWNIKRLSYALQAAVADALGIHRPARACGRIPGGRFVWSQQDEDMQPISQNQGQRMVPWSCRQSWRRTITSCSPR